MNQHCSGVDLNFGFAARMALVQTCMMVYML